jgi:GNAT superfamily N-acetyltransferase
VSARLATPADIPRVVPALAAAFAGDPPLSHLLPDATRRRARLERYFAALLPRLYLPLGEVWVTEEPAGAAVWVAPERWPPTLRDQRPVAATLARTFWRNPVRALASSAVIERGHPREPHWYLDYLGVDPAGHGRGTGSALLAPVLERCDRVGAAAFLNAGSPRSRELYRRHGFEVTEEFSLPFGGPPLWRMWRRPR